MSDDASPAKRGRKSNAEKAAEKIDAKKRTRKEIKPANNDGSENDADGASPVKRGRGRPKGSTKKKAAVKPKSKTTSGPGRRGRPKKEEVNDSGDEDGDDNDAAEDEED